MRYDSTLNVTEDFLEKGYEPEHEHVFGSGKKKVQKSPISTENVSKNVTKRNGYEGSSKRKRPSKNISLISMFGSTLGEDDFEDYEDFEG